MFRFLLVTGALAVLPLESGATSQVVRVVIDELAGGTAQPTSINNRGTIVGAMSPSAPQLVVPFRWTERGGVEFFLGMVPGQATDVNDAGAIVGLLGSDAPFTGFLWTHQQGFVNLGTGFLPTAINNRGQIVGTIIGEFGATGPYLWENGELTELGGDAPYGVASDINERGQVVGQVVLNAFLWSSKAGLTRLPHAATGPNPVSAAYSVNNSGETVGFESENGVEQFPVRWTRTGEPILFAAIMGTFVGLNDSGMAVGVYASDSAANGFISTRHGDVIQLGPGRPVAINNGGAVVGTAVVEGTNRVVVWLVSSRT